MSDLSIRVGSETGIAVAPDLWGLFFEDINNCLDGGLNAELVQNGDFEFSVRDHPDWNALTAWRVSCPGNVTVRHEDPIHPNNGTYIRAVGPVTVTNEGWDGVGAEVGDEFRLSFAAWRVWGDGVITASIGGDEGVIAMAQVPVPDTGWNHVDVDVRAKSAGRGLLSFEIPDGLTLELDVISLRPLDDKGKPRTFRADLIAALRDLEPSFVRFPGGCVAHGLGLNNLYHWKPTIGPRHERDQISNFWGYHQSRQIGYLEYFELCQLLGATPLPVLAAGVCCPNTRGGPKPIPTDEMPAYTQDILDLVEFANGGPETTWGAIRAGLGHPESFELRYLGIGNEDQITDDFRERFAQIEDALRQHRPEVQIIGTAGPSPYGIDWEAGWAFARHRGTDIVDEHAYRTPRWFHQNVDRYDSYSRTESKVYFGEYAARTNSVRAALAEAAFMVGMERNSDVVKLASYAPLLARIGGTQWDPDLIFFDAERVLPTASYYVQQLFSEQRGTHLRALTLDGAEPVAVTIPRDGRLRFRSPGAAFEISGLVVDGAGTPMVETDEDGETVEVGAVDPTAAEIEFEATRMTGTEGLSVRLGGSDTFLEFVIPYWTGLDTIFYSYDAGISEDDDGPVRWGSMITGESVRVRLSLSGARVRAWIDGELQHDYERDLRSETRVIANAASREGDSGTEYVVRIVNATDDERMTHLTGPSGATLTGGGRVLAGSAPDTGRAFEESPVRPEPIVTDDAGVMIVPPWSLVVVVVSES